MPKKRLSDEQIAFALRQAKSGTPVGEICRKWGWPKRPSTSMARYAAKLVTSV
jgi:hypothetical protein